jgi:ABC-type dipeptide/oligopeptide/nickel transport systems, permease components
MNRKIVLLRMRKNPFFVIGSIVALIIVVLTVLAPVLCQYDPVKNALAEKFIAPEWFSKGAQGHIMGTDQLGRDVFTRLLYGARFSLGLASLVVILQVLIGTCLGLAAGYLGGIVDSIVMRACDIILAIPNLILAIAIMAVLGPNVFNLVFVLTLSGWVQCCKITRNNVRVIKNREFVYASRALGAKNMHIMFNQIFPNVTTHIIILASQSFGLTILVEAALSFLSLGIQPPDPSWGNMIAAGRTYMTVYPWLVFAPGVALMMTVLAFNFLGDGLRDVLDPKRTR